MHADDHITKLRPSAQCPVPSAFRRTAFTLVEILIVVVILGILAALVVANFTRATEDAAVNTTVYELGKLRRAIGVYRARTSSLPAVTAGDGTWGQIVGLDDSYLSAPPVNAYVGGDNRHVIVIGTTPDADYQTNHGWIYDDNTGAVWAGGFSVEDEPLPKP